MLTKHVGSRQVAAPDGSWLAMRLGCGRIGPPCSSASPWFCTPSQQRQSLCVEVLWNKHQPDATRQESAEDLHAACLHQAHIRALPSLPAKHGCCSSRVHPRNPGSTSTASWSHLVTAVGTLGRLPLQAARTEAHVAPFVLCSNAGTCRVPHAAIVVVQPRLCWQCSASIPTQRAVSRGRPNVLLQTFRSTLLRRCKAPPMAGSGSVVIACHLPDPCLQTTGQPLESC
jgi:hypothetical protein